MSFLQSAGAGAALAGAPAANSAATGLGRIIGADPSRVSQIAGGIGKVANGVATAGGAPPGYDAQVPDMPQPSNYLQNLDPIVLRAIMAKFGPAQNAGMVR